MGVMFARREGQRADIPPIAMGSHLDTQPTGGKFDGALGVLGALEALQTLHAAGYETFAPIEVVNWTNEEGSRFAPAMRRLRRVRRRLRARLGDGAHRPRRRHVRRCAGAIGYRGPQRCGDHPLSAFFELHIEQGPLLEAEGKEIGIVTGMQGMRWYEVTITGQDAHTGATPMHLRKNALLGAARLVERVEAIARAHAPLAVATVGSMEVKPNSPNVVPGEVFFTVDLRHPDLAVLDAMDAALAAALREVVRAARARRVVDQDLGPAADRVRRRCIACVRARRRDVGLSARDIVSGASHDAAYVSRVAPTAMIFVPCRDGISHNETEFSSKEQCAAGAQVLLQAVLDYDRRLAERYADGKSG